MMGYPGSSSEVFRITVLHALTGDSFDVKCSGNVLGKEFWHLLAAQKIPLFSPKTLKSSYWRRSHEIGIEPWIR